MKPKVTTNCVANRYANRDERIIEFSHNGKGGLILFRELEDGTLLVEPYRLDDTVKVNVKPSDIFQRS